MGDRAPSGRTPGGSGGGGGAGGTLSQAKSAPRLRCRRVDKLVSVKSTSSTVRRSRSHMELHPPSQQAGAASAGPHGAGGTVSSGRCAPVPPAVASAYGIGAHGASARHCASVSMQSRQRDEADGRHLPLIL